MNESLSHPVGQWDYFEVLAFKINYLISRWCPGGGLATLKLRKHQGNAAEFWLSAHAAPPRRLPVTSRSARTESDRSTSEAESKGPYAAAAIDFKNPSISACRLVVEADNCLADDSSWLDAAPV